MRGGGGGLAQKEFHTPEMRCAGMRAWMLRVLWLGRLNGKLPR